MLKMMYSLFFLLMKVITKEMIGNRTTQNQKIQRFYKITMGIKFIYFVQHNIISF
jgi:hypothetical protein